MRTFVVDEPRAGALRALNYAPAVERIRRAGSDSARPLREIVKTFGPAYGTVFTRRDCRPDHGIQLLSQTDTFAAEPLGRTIRRDSMPYPNRHEIRRWQILISGAGQMGEGNLFGRSIIADRRLEGAFLGPDTFAIGFEEPGSDLNLWTYAVLNSSLGLQGIRAAAYGTSIPHLRSDLLGSLPIPAAPTEVISRVAELVRLAVVHREAHLRDLREARSIIDGLPETREAHELCAERTRHTVLWSGPFPTLSAWTFASTGGVLALLQKRWSQRLEDYVEEDGIFNGLRFVRTSCVPPHGVDLMSQRDALLIRPVPRRIVVPPIPTEMLFARAGTILVGAQGTLGEGEIFGRALFVTDRLANVAFTQHLLRIVPQQGFEEQLYAFLTTTVGFRLLRSTAVGTKLLSMRPDLLRALPIPDLGGSVGARVQSLIRAAFQARDDANEAETKAIRIIEQEVLPQWLA